MRALPYDTTLATSVKTITAQIVAHSANELRNLLIATFLSALRAYPELPADANVEAWLVTIAHRRALDVGRARTRRAIPVESPPDRPSARADPAARDPDLWAALRRLPDTQRLAVAYHHIAGLPFAELAALLGNSPDAARRAAADGIKTLRKHYPEDETA